MSTATLEAPPTRAEAFSEYEIERGKPMPSFNHGMIQANLITEFARSRDYRPVSEVTLDLGMDHNVTPDISLFPRRPMDLWHDANPVKEVPQFVVEIASASQSSSEMVPEVHDYLQHGVPACWLVDPPMHQVTVFTADGKRKIYDEGIVTDPVTGLTADLAVVFS